MTTISKKHLCKLICERMGSNAVDVEPIVQEFMVQVIKNLQKGHRLEFRDFGVFELRRRKARIARNPKTGELINVPPRTVVAFRAGKYLKEHVIDVIPLPRDGRSKVVERQAKATGPSVEPNQ